MDAEDFLFLEYQEKKYTLKQFALTYTDPGNEFLLDNLLKECVIEYKNTKMTFHDYCKKTNDFADSLEISKFYFQELLRFKIPMFAVSSDYYIALKMIDAVEKQLIYARYYLIMSHGILDFNINANWQAGYAAMYYKRTFDASTAIMWYNTIFDTILQVAYFAFGFYKQINDYENKTFHELLKYCEYSFVCRLYGSNKTVRGFEELWGIIIKAYNATNKIREWTNFIKHKGGINYIGVTAEPSYSLKLINGSTVIKDDDFEFLNLELDDVILEMHKAHPILVNTLGELITFVDFKSALPDKNGTIPDATKYKKIILP